MAKQFRQYDLVVFGATGFTGQYAVEEVAKAAKKEKEKGFPEMSWAIAGRNESKLKESLFLAEKETGLDLHDVGLLIVNVTDKASIENMTRNSKVIINCVGPYHLYGRPIVESCVKNGTSQVDITGEPQYRGEIKLEFDEEAEKSGAHIINSCGFDSVPADVGLCHLTKNFPGRLNSAHGFVRGTGATTSIHTGTMESAASIIPKYKEIKELDSQLYPDELPKPQYPKSRHYGFHKNSELQLWGLPFPSDEGVVYQSQRYLSEKTDLSFVQYQGFLGNRGLPLLVGLAFGVFYFVFISYWSFTRKLLFKHPKLMTAGIFTKDGPSRESLLKSGFRITIVGEGWKEKLMKNEKYTYPPDHKMIMDISGPDPAYRGTSILLVACAMTILREKEDCSEPGGVMSPGMAFVNTTIVDRLIEGGININMTEAEKISN